MNRSIPPAFVLALVVLSATTAHAIDLADVKAAVRKSEVALNFRYRYEFVEQSGFDKDADASTLRSRLTWTSGALGHVQAGLEADYVSVIGDERYNSTTNGYAQYPVVPDPEGFDLNQAFLRYSDDGVKLTAGRQRILHADQRFVGGVGWRQNEQTFDAARAELKLGATVALDYAYTWNVNRIFGPDDGVQPADWRADAHLLLAHWQLAKVHGFSGFAYLLDFENDNGIPNSTATYGLTYRGQLGPVSILASYATQTDYAQSPLDYRADYFSVAASGQVAAVGLSFGYEVLGSDDGTAAFRTPLATLHKFQGFFDQFLNTPAAGVEDLSATASTQFGPLKLALAYHDFSAEQGSADYGREIDATATWIVRDELELELKFADYDAEDFGVDGSKLWFSVIVKL